MKKFLSVLLSFVFCASVTVTNPPVEMGNQIFNPPQEEHYGDDEGMVIPCDEDPGSGGDVQA